MHPTVADTNEMLEQNRSLAEAEGVEASVDTDDAIRQGGQAIEAEGNDLGRSASGELRDIDLDTARQRLRDCQGALISLGYQLGAHDDPAEGITGVMDAGTLEAVKQFQDDNDLDIDGVIDRETYEALLLGFEQAMSMRAHVAVDDDFMPMHAGEPMQAGAGRTADGEQIVAQAIDDSEESLLTLRDSFANGDGEPDLAEDL